MRLWRHKGKSLYLVLHKKKEEKNTATERSVIRQNQIMLTIIVSLSLGAIIKRESHGSAANALCGLQWSDDDALKFIFDKDAPLGELLEDFW